MTHKSNKAKHNQQQTRWIVITPLSYQTKANCWPPSNPGSTADLAEKIAAKTVRGYAPIHWQRAYGVHARGEKTKWHPTPLECLGREIERGNVEKPERGCEGENRLSFTLFLLPRTPNGPCCHHMGFQTRHQWRSTCLRPRLHKKYATSSPTKDANNSERN